MSTYKIVGGDRKEYGPVTAEQVRQWVAEGRANADTLVQGEGGVWKKLATFAEFADVLPAAPVASAGGGAPPPTISAAAMSSGAGGLPPLGGPDPGAARGYVQGPAIGMMIVGLLGAPTNLLGLVMNLAGMPFMFHQSSGEPAIDQFMRFMMGPLGAISSGIQLLVSVLVFIGGLRMMSMKNYGLCMAAAILAVIPCTSPCCCLIGMPIGIWALVVLSRAEVKSAFS